MRATLIFLFVLFSLSLNSQYYITREQIQFYIDGELLEKERSDSIPVFIKLNNKILPVADTAYLGDDGDLEVSCYFIIENRAISFRRIEVKNFFDELNEEWPRKYMFYYTHIEKMRPIEKTDYGGDWEKKRRKRYLKEAVGNEPWYFPPIKIDEKKVPNNIFYFGVARLQHSKTSLNSFYRVHDYKYLNGK